MHTLSRARLLIWAALAFIVIVGAQTRISFFLEHRASLTIQDDSSTYLSMAANLHRGIGWIDPADRARFDADRMGFTPVAADDAHVVPFYGGIDLGYALIYWIALHTFGLFVPALLAMVYLQIAVDSFNVLLMFWLGKRILGPGLGLAAAAIYAGLWLPVSLNATIPFYYPWTGTFALWNFVLTSLLLDERFPDESIARRVSTSVAWGLTLGVASSIRSLFLPLGLLLSGLVLLRHRRHLKTVLVCVAIAVAVQWLSMVPVYAHNYARFGRFNTRWMWHTAYIGFGAHPNPWGIKWDDTEGFKRAARDGVSADDPDFVIHYDDHMHQVVSAMMAEQPMLVLRNAVENLSYGVSGEDGGLVLSWNVGGRPLSYNYQLPFTVPSPWSSPQTVVTLLLAFQALWFVLWRGRLADPWSYAAVLLSTGFMLGVVSMLCPPYATYNAAYGPAYALFLGVAVVAFGRGLGALVGLFRAALASTVEIARVNRVVASTWLVLFAPALYYPHVRVVPQAVQAAVALAAVLACYLCVRTWLSATSARAAAAVVTAGLALGLAWGWGEASEHTLVQIGFPAGLQILGGVLPLLLLTENALSPPVVGLLALATTALHSEMLWLPATFCLLASTHERPALVARLRTAAWVVAIVGTPLSVMSRGIDWGSLAAPVAFLVLTLVPRGPIATLLAVAILPIKMPGFPAWRLLAPALLVGGMVELWTRRRRPAESDDDPDCEPLSVAAGKGSGAGAS